VGGRYQLIQLISPTGSSPSEKGRRRFRILTLIAWGAQVFRGILTDSNCRLLYKRERERKRTEKKLTGERVLHKAFGALTNKFLGQRESQEEDCQKSLDPEEKAPSISNIMRFTQKALE